MLKIRSLFFASIFASTLVGGFAVNAETLRKIPWGES